MTDSIDIIDFPDLGGAPENIDVTTLTDTKQVGIKGIDSSGALVFTANYTKIDYNTVKTAASTAKYYSLVLGSGDKFTWQGSHSVYVTGAGVNEPVQMKIVIAPITQFVLS